MITLIPSLIHEDAANANVDHVVDHIMYAGKLIGYDHIGLGSDLDGMFSAVQGIDDVSKWHNLVAKMLERGISRSNIEKVLGLNIIRVLEATELCASKLKNTSPTMEDSVKQLWKDNFRAMVEGVYPHAEKSRRDDITERSD